MAAKTEVFYSGLNGSKNFRIPSLITTGKGTLIAAIDARIESHLDNPNNIDKYIRRSTDGGRTWGDVKVAVKCPGKGADGAAACDPAMLYDKISGTIWMIYCQTPAGTGLLNSKPGTGFDSAGNRLLYDGAGSMFVLKNDGAVYDENGQKTDYYVLKNGEVSKAGKMEGNIYLKDGSLTEAKTSFLQAVKSDDDGLTWSGPIDLNPQVKEDWMGFIGAGPGRGIQTENGRHPGRLIFPIYYTNEYGFMSNCVIYSDDHGSTWHRGKSPNDVRIMNGERLCSKTLQSYEAMLTESQLIELENGDLKIFIRNHAPYRRTAFAISSDAGETWGDVHFDDTLPDPICQSSVISHRFKDGVTRVLFANPADTEKRINGTIRISCDEGRTWKQSINVKGGYFGYSCLSIGPDEEIFLMYEGEEEFKTITFEGFTLEKLENGISYQL